jgi:hypothetical protein
MLFVGKGFEGQLFVAVIIVHIHRNVIEVTSFEVEIRFVVA